MASANVTKGEITPAVDLDEGKIRQRIGSDARTAFSWPFASPGRFRRRNWGLILASSEEFFAFRLRSKGGNKPMLFNLKPRPMTMRSLALAGLSAPR
jgi:hypothetical protein